MNDTPQGQDPTPESTPLDPGPTPAPDLAPKPDPEPVQDVQDDELDNLEEEGEANVQELPPQAADADPTVDNTEDDTPGGE